MSKFSCLLFLLFISFVLLAGWTSNTKNIKDSNDITNVMKQIIQTAHNLDIKIIAEGIETEDDLNILKEMKLDFYQSYFIGRPDPEEL